MSFLSNNIAVFAIALLMMSLSWVWGGTRGDLLLSFVPWLSLILVEVMFVFPQRLPYETADESRLRVWRAVRGDRLAWACGALLLLLAVPFVNTKLHLLPWCVNRLSHLNVYQWFFTAFLAMIAVKHSLRRHGKRLLVKVLVWNGVALAAFGFLEVFTGAKGPFWSDPGMKVDFFASFGYPNMAGDYFTTLTFLAVGLWRRQLAETQGLDISRKATYQIFWLRHYPLIAVTILYFAALNTLSRSAIILATLGTIFLFVHAGAMRLKRLHRAQRLKFSAVLLFTVIALWLSALLFMPNSVRREIHTLNSHAVLDRLTGKSQYHTTVAAQLLWDYPLFGCGGWGYMYLCTEKLSPEIIRMHIGDGGQWYRGTANVHNDYMQFLCEHGLISFALLALIFYLAVKPTVKCWQKLAKIAHFSKHTGLPRPKGFFCFPPMGVSIVASVIATMIHALGDCPFRSPAVMSLFFVLLTAIDGYLPHGRDEHKK